MPIEQVVTFGDLLRRYRVAAGLTQEELAERAGLSARGISDLERGVKVRPRQDTIALLAEALCLAPRERAVFEAARKRGVPTAVARAGLRVVPPSGPEVRLPPFVGHMRELAVLERHLAGEGPPLLLLAGEPGIGKSRLLEEAAQRALTQGLSVLAGGCQRQGGQEPYAPLLQAVEGHIRAHTQRQLGASLRGCAWLVRLLPELVDSPIEPLPSWTLPPAQERRLLFHAVGHYLANVAGPGGTLLLLDDLQWAGADALDLLIALVRAASVGSSGAAGPLPPLRVLGAYRDSEVTAAHVLSGVLADLAQAGLARQHSVAPLAPPDAAHLFDSLLAGAEGAHPLRERVLQRTGGVPFFLVSCTQALRARAVRTAGDAQASEHGAAGEVDPVPWDVAQGVRQRVAALPVAAQEVLGVAAVIGRQASTSLLCAATARPEVEVLEALEMASRARLLIDEGTESYCFAHDVIREVVESDLGTYRRTLLHQQIAEGLEQQPGGLPVEQLAYHYARGANQGRAVLYLEQAGDRARARHANVEADEYYSALVDRLDLLGRPLDAARVREKSGAAQHTLARFDGALKTLEQAADAYRVAGDMDGLGRTIAQIGRVHAHRGTPGEGLDRLQPVLDLVAMNSLAVDGPQRGLAALFAALAHLLFVTGRTVEHVEAARRAEELARTTGDNRLLAEAHAWHGMAVCILGRLEEGVPLMVEAVEVAERIGDASTLAWALHGLAQAYLLLGDFDRSGQFGERALPAAELVGDPVWLMHDLAHSGFIAFHAGDWPRARADGERAAALQREIGVAWSSSYPLSCLGELCFAEGRWDEAVPYLEASSALAISTGDGQALRLAQRVLAELDLLHGRPQAALERLAALYEPSGQDTWDVRRLLPYLAWAYLELGQAPLAVETATRAVEGARSTGERLTLVDALRVQALIVLRQGQWLEAAHILDEALALARSMGYPWGEARVLHVYGELHLQRGEPEPARQRLEAALAIFRRLGAREAAGRVVEAISGLARHDNAALSQNGPLARTALAVSDTQWEQIRPLLPPGGRAGRPRTDDRHVLDAILYKVRTGCAWGNLPPALGDGATAHRRLRRWQAAGLWERIGPMLGLTETDLLRRERPPPYEQMPKEVERARSFLR